MSFTVNIGVCTFRREHVVTTLASLSLLERPLDCKVRVIVADNDEDPSAQVTVAAAAEKYELDVTYIHAPARNISTARNACLDASTGDYFAFIDDDEVVHPEWLTAMLTTQFDTKADIILGPVNALYAEDAARWLQVGNFHSTRPFYVKGKITTGYAGNVFMKITAPILKDLRFRSDLGVTGGEDTEFFDRAISAGAKIVYAEHAIAYEGVPPERAKLSWLLARKFRFGQTHAKMLMESGKPRLYHLVLATGKMLLCYGMVIVTALFPLARRQWLLRGRLHQGVVSALTHAA